eukprot:168968-Amphidinium_carterae.1
MFSISTQCALQSSIIETEAEHISGANNSSNSRAKLATGVKDKLSKAQAKRGQIGGQGTESSDAPGGAEVVSNQIGHWPARRDRTLDGRAWSTCDLARLKS